MRSRYERYIVCNIFRQLNLMNLIARRSKNRRASNAVMKV